MREQERGETGVFWGKNSEFGVGLEWNATDLKGEGIEGLNLKVGI